MKNETYIPASCEIKVLRALPTGCAFAMTDTQEEAFIPATVMCASGLEQGDEAVADIIPNGRYLSGSSNVPWFVTFAKPTSGELDDDLIDEEDEIARPASHTQRNIDVIAVLRDAGRAMSMLEIANAIAGTSYDKVRGIKKSPDMTVWSKVQNQLDHLHEEGRVARWEMHRRAGQSRPGRVLYTLDGTD